MARRPFVHLHVASGYSLRYGASTPAALVHRAAEHGYDALALTDRDGLYGAVKFVLAARHAGLRPIVGVDLAVRSSAHPAVRDTGRAAVASRSSPRTPVRGGADVDPRYPRITMLARGGGGWAALCQLITAVHLAGERGEPVLDLNLLAEHAGREHLVVLLGPDSEVGRAVAARRPDRARALLQPWLEVMGRAGVRIEIVSHRALPATVGSGALRVPPALSSSLAARMYGFACAAKVPAVLTNAVRYADSASAPVVDVLDAARRLVPLDPRHIDRHTSGGYLAGPETMERLAVEVVESAGLHGRDATRAVDGLFTETRAVAESCMLDLRADLGIGDVHLPETSLVVSEAGADANRILRARCLTGLTARGLPDTADVGNRLERELDVIAGLGYATYFLTVADIVDLIRSMQVRVAARGSGAGSLVNYALRISGVDPIRNDLVFERFLSPQRRGLPDIDLDVESARRTEVYERIIDRYGQERVACVSMMDTYRVRHAVRDVGAALGMPLGEVDAIAKAFPHIAARDARAAIRELPELRSYADPKLEAFFGLVEALDGLPRHVALHPCGVLVSNLTLRDRTPVEASFLGFPMSQFDKDDVEEMGLLKLDVLGIRMQSAMSHAVAEIQRVDGIEVDLDAQTAGLDDPATFDLVRSTRTLGCFQIESPGQRELIGKFAPETFADLVIDISLFRPGPVKSDMIHPFLRARQGWCAPEYLHESLRPALAETYGVVVFHEQIIRMVSVAAGVSLAEGEEIRRALGSTEGLAKTRAWFYPRALAQGYDLDTIERMWDVLHGFASFGFCKAHAAAFALPTYQSAWLKTHHCAAFLAGVLSHDPGMYPKRLILEDARQFGVGVLPCDVNRSDGLYRIEPVTSSDADSDAATGYGIRLSLADVKGISDLEVERIVAARPYSSLGDFWHRAGVSRPVVERLVTIGAFDSIHGLDRPGVRRGAMTRRDLLLQVADLDRWSGRTRRMKTVPRVDEGTQDVQLVLDLVEPDAGVRAGLPEMTDTERVRAELDVLGLDASRHVIDFYAPMLDAIGVTRARSLLRCRAGAEVLVAGVKVATQTPPVRSGRRVVFLTLDDTTGPVDLTFFEDVQGPYAATVFHSWLIVARGEIRRTGPRGISLRATGAWELGVIHETWLSGGAGAVLDLIDADRPEGVDNGPGYRRILVHPSGYRQSPYADVRPAGGDVQGTRSAAASAPRKLWHTSPGSAGR